MSESTADILLQQSKLAQQQVAAGNLAAGQALYAELAAQADNDPALNLQLALLSTQLHDSEAANHHLNTVISSSPEEADTLVTLAKCLGDLNQHEKAIALARQALEKDAQHGQAQALLGSLLTEAGETAAAQEQFEAMIATGTSLRLAYTNLARLRTFTTADSALFEQAKSVLESGISPREKLAVHFALGKMFDDCADYGQAFAHFRQANLLQKEPYDHNNDLNWFNQVQTVFTAANIARLSENGHSSAQPVFVVGMPRSGTTLMERIIASHSEGAGAGELVAMAQIAHQVMRENESKPEERALRRLTGEQLQQYADHYLQSLRLGQPAASRIVDKLPGNYQNIGLIHCLFPRATIIHAVRHPLDTCLSCYFQAFAEVRWSNALKSIADTYKLYRQYMSYWHKVLPPGKILDIHYETLVQNPSEESQRMLAHCGLDWEANSLEFHQQQAVVRTVSHAQVRQPIYQTSTMRWMNYANNLQGLVDELAEYLDSDREALKERGLLLKKKKRFGFF